METVRSNEAVAVLSPELVYGFFLCRLAVPVSLGHCGTSLASSSSGYADMLTEPYQFRVLAGRYNYTDEAVLLPISKSGNWRKSKLYFEYCLCSW